MAVTLALAATACSTGGPTDLEGAPETIEVASPALAAGRPIPLDLTCEGQDVPPPLAWSGGPVAQEYVVLLLDADAGGFVHWSVFGIPGSVRALDPADLPAGALEGANDFNHIGYGGPCPPEGDAPHRYEFTVLALGQGVSGRLRSAATSDEIERVIACCIAAKGVLAGTFGR